MFWDGERWLPDDGRPPAQPRKRSDHRLRNRFSIVVMAFALVGLLLPVAGITGVTDVAASTRSARTLLATWSADSKVAVYQEIQQQDQLPGQLGHRPPPGLPWRQGPGREGRQGQGHPQVQRGSRLMGRAGRSDPRQGQGLHRRQARQDREHLGVPLPPGARAVPEVVEHRGNAQDLHRHPGHPWAPDGRHRRVPRPPRHRRHERGHGRRPNPKARPQAEAQRRSARPGRRPTPTPTAHGRRAPPPRPPRRPDPAVAPTPAPHASRPTPASPPRPAARPRRPRSRPTPAPTLAPTPAPTVAPDPGAHARADPGAHARARPRAAATPRAHPAPATSPRRCLDPGPAHRAGRQHRHRHRGRQRDVPVRAGDERQAVELALDRRAGSRAGPARSRSGPRRAAA